MSLCVSSGLSAWARTGRLADGHFLYAITNADKGCQLISSCPYCPYVHGIRSQHHRDHEQRRPPPSPLSVRHQQNIRCAGLLRLQRSHSRRTTALGLPQDRWTCQHCDARQVSRRGFNSAPNHSSHRCDHYRAHRGDNGFR